MFDYDNEFSCTEYEHDYYERDKDKRAIRRKQYFSHRKQEARKSMNYQRAADKFRKCFKKKGYGLAHKQKGETMPTQICANNKNVKGWVKAFGGTESFKTAFIYAAT